jgi:hypothetical protein
MLKTRFRTFISQVRALNLDLLLLAHDKEDKDGDLRVVRPDITGGSYAEVLKNADFVGYMSMVGKSRLLDFSPTDRYIGKNPAAWQPFVVPPAAKATEFMADLYARAKAALGTISEASALVATEVHAWRTTFATLRTVDDLNKQIPLVKAISLPTIQAQASKLLLDRAETLKVPFDKKTKKFVAAPDPVAA